MERVKSICKRLFCLPPLPTVLIATVSFAAVIYVLATETEGTAFTYLAYGASAYALVITVTGVPRILGAARRAVGSSALIGRVVNSAYGRRFRGDIAFRTEVSLYRGLCINLLYAVFKLASGIYYRSLWFGALAVYYMLLALIRFTLLRDRNKNAGGRRRAAELYRYRLCGIMLLVMNQALAGIVILVVHQNRGFVYPGMLIYVMALYAFYTVITAVINVVKFRKLGSPVLSAAKAVNLTAALVSMLSLETAMLTQFDTTNDPAFRQVMTGATGGAVCAIVLGMAVFMIAHSTKQLKRLEMNRK